MGTTKVLYKEGSKSFRLIASCSGVKLKIYK